MNKSFLKFLLSPPSVTLNLHGKNSYKKLRLLLENNTNRPKILQVGCGESFGGGIVNLGETILHKMINLDIRITPLTNVIGDAIALPFLNNQFDGVIIQATLQYTKNPVLVAKEIYRVLKPGGYVYVEAPFFEPFYPNHNDKYRFTKTGLQTLFEEFQEIECKINQGPTSTFTTALVEFGTILLSFNSTLIYKVALTILRWLFSPLKYLDILLVKNKFAYFISGGYSYLGRRKCRGGNKNESIYCQKNNISYP